MMRRPIPLLILLLAPVVATGCREAPVAKAVIPPEPRDVYVSVKAHLENGVPRIDQTYHHSELVRPGDKLSFACECEDGLELTVSEPNLVIDVDALESLIEGQKGKDLEDNLMKLLDKLKADPESGKTAYSAGDDDTRGFLPAFLEGFMAVISPPAPEVGMFGKGWRQPDFHPGDQSIGPFTVGPIDRESVWKFTWKVRVQGQPGSEVSWDPHLMGNPDL